MISGVKILYAGIVNFEKVTLTVHFTWWKGVHVDYRSTMFGLDSYVREKTHDHGDYRSIIFWPVSSSRTYISWEENSSHPVTTLNCARSVNF